MREQDLGATKMEERLYWAKIMMEKLTNLSFDNMPVELKVKTIEVGISLFIQSERSYSMKKQ
jgi:hypothetical protein